MGLIKRNTSSTKKDSGDQKQTNRRETLYVTVSSHKAIFIVAGKPKEAKYSYGLPIIPLHGYYYSPRHKRTFTAKELSDYYVILNVPKDSVSEDELFEMSDARLVVVGYYNDEIYLEEPDEEVDEGEERGEESEEEKNRIGGMGESPIKGEKNGNNKQKKTQK